MKNIEEKIVKINPDFEKIGQVIYIPSRPVLKIKKEKYNQIKILLSKYEIDREIDNFCYLYLNFQRVYIDACAYVDLNLTSEEVSNSTNRDHKKIMKFLQEIDGYILQQKGGLKLKSLTFETTAKGRSVNLKLKSLFRLADFLNEMRKYGHATKNHIIKVSTYTPQTKFIQIIEESIYLFIYIKSLNKNKLKQAEKIYEFLFHFFELTDFNYKKIFTSRKLKVSLNIMDQLDENETIKESFIRLMKRLYTKKLQNEYLQKPNRPQPI